MRFGYLIFLLFMSYKISLAMDYSPEILRVCYDDNTKTATIYWKTPLDNCNSFKKYHIYVNEFGASWIQKATITNLSFTQAQVSPIIDVNALFKIVTYSACNGLDSFISNIKTIDKIGPDYMSLDSVSFDQASQNLIVGWKKNPSIDTKGFWIYKTINPVNSKITETDKSMVILNGYDKTNPTNISIAAFDSCNNFSAISNSQRAAYLSGAIDSCKKEIKIEWKKYSGWRAINQYLITNINNTGFAKYKNLLSSDTTFLISGINMGDNLCYYIRTEDSSTKKTSSSNTICFKTRKLVIPQINYLSNVSIEDDSYINITYKGDSNSDIDSLILEKTATGNQDFQPIKRLKYNKLIPDIEIKDLISDFNQASYTYRVSGLDKCNFLISISNYGSSIFLVTPTLINSTSYRLRWNIHFGWEKGVSNQLIETSNDRFTWNVLKNENSSVTEIIISPGFLEKDSLCFRISNIEIPNSYGESSTTVSNVKCIYAITDFYFPETLNPASHNNTFRIYGLGLDKSRGKMEIYNRWGEKVFETNNLTEGWDSKINNEFADQGSYLYKVCFYDQLNRYYLKTGSVLVIR